MWRAPIPRASRNPSQNWCVDQRFRTRGIPTRSFARVCAVSALGAMGSLEGGLANHFSSVWVGIFHGLHAFLDDTHLVHVFEQSLRTRIAADDALPSRLERDLAPRTALPVGKPHVDERALAAHRA